MDHEQGHDPNRPGEDLLRIVRRPWRIAFVVFATLLTTATHWPALQLPEQAPATDKSLHCIAFALATWLLWRAAWTRMLWLVLLIALGWAAIDEVTQMIPGLNRWVSWADFAANVCGVAVAGIWIWALQPVGEHANRRRLARQAWMFDQITCDRETILAAISVSVILIGVGAMSWRFASPDVTRTTLIILALLWPSLMIAIIRVRWPKFAKQMMRDRPCFVCARQQRAKWAEGVRQRCADCGCMLDEDQWAPFELHPSRARVVRMRNLPVIAGAAIVGVLCVTLLIPELFSAAMKIWLLGNVYVWIGETIGHGGTIGALLELSLLLIMLAVGVRLHRVRIAQMYDQHMKCRGCGSDLRGTITTGTGVGRCSSCGALFRRRS